jgi:hypothetical protein
MDNNQSGSCSQQADGGVESVVPLGVVAAGNSALCLSGGGIRSATFSLGVVQALAKFGWLSQFDYLSTVSGGGYIGGWLSGWIRRVQIDANGRIVAAHNVEDQLRRSVTEGRTEPEQIRRLRAYSNYLSPVAGVSGDMLTLISIFIRNLSLNWLVLIPLLAAVVLVPIVYVSAVISLHSIAGSTWLSDGCYIAAGLCALTAIAYATSDLPQKSTHQTITNEFARLWMLPMIVGCVTLSLPISYVVIYASADHPVFNLWMVAGLSATIHLIGVAIGIVFRAYRQINSDERAEPVVEFGRSLGEARDWAYQRARRVGKAISDLGWPGVAAVLVSGTTAGILIWALIWLAHLAFVPDTPGSQLVPGFDIRRLMVITFVVPCLMIIFQTGTTVYCAVLADRSDEGAREWWGRSGGYALGFCAVWLLLLAVCIWIPGEAAPEVQKAIAAAGGLGGLVAAVGGYFGRNSVRGADDTNARPLRVRLMDGAARIGAAVFIIALFAFLSWVVVRFVAYMHYENFLAAISSGGWTWFVALVVAATIGRILSWIIPRNRYSMAALYGNRIVRAYLGSTRTLAERRPHAFTHFDPTDDIPLAELGTSGPLQHILNGALNVSQPTESELAWQERKSAPFVFCADSCGRPELRGVYATQSWPTEKYAAEDGISLGRAIAISGAAASPNMGFHTSPLVAFVLTFFNIRLGAWLPNPIMGTAREEEIRQDTNASEQVRLEELSKLDQVMKKEEPESFLSLIRELTGRTKTAAEFIYVSDGGHFENLGLYEMVNRGCTRILVVDASCDPKYQYDDLERALRIIRADLGVTISFDNGLPRPKETGLASQHWAIGKIDYGANKVGRLIYLKPCLTGDEHPDVIAFAARSIRNGIPFPHHSTADQFFDEARFESYRALGYHSLNCANQEGGVPAFEDFALTCAASAAIQSTGSLADQLAVLAKEEARSDTSSSGFTKWLVGILAVGLLSPVAYKAVRPAGDNYLVLLPNQYQLALHAPDALHAIFISVHDRIALPLFEEAEKCIKNGLKNCGRGVTVSAAGKEALKHLNLAIDRCGTEGGLAQGRNDTQNVEIVGYSSSADFSKDLQPPVSTVPIGVRNTRLADLRACKVRAYISDQATGRVAYSVRSWNGKYMSSDDCDSVESRTYKQEDIASLDRARTKDVATDGTYDPVLGALNRRVELIPASNLSSLCSIERLEQGLAKYYDTKESIPEPADQAK